MPTAKNNKNPRAEARGFLIYLVIAEKLLEYLMEARGRNAGDQAGQDHRRRDAGADIRPDGNAKSQRRHDQRNVSVVEGRAVLDQQAHKKTDAQRHKVDVFHRPRYVRGINGQFGHHGFRHGHERHGCDQEQDHCEEHRAESTGDGFLGFELHVEILLTA